LSEFKSRIAVGGVIALVLGLSLGIGLTYLPNGLHASSTASSTTFVASSSASGTSTLPSTTLSSSTVTLTSSSESSTTELPVIVTNSTIQLNPSLNVSLAQSALLDNNATVMAQSFAGALNQSLVGSTKVIMGFGSIDYSFETNTNSTLAIAISLSPSVLQVTYRAQNWNETGNSSAVNSGFNVLAANRYAAAVMNSIGIPIHTVNLTNTIPTFTPNDYVIQWIQSYQDVPFVGSLTQNPDGSYFFSSTQAYFDFNPASAENGTTSAGTLKQAILVNPYWYVIPSTFPQKISLDNASALAENYAIHDLGMNIVSNIQVNFATVKDHLYYLVTVSGNGSVYQIFVDPSNGEVGFPQ
jgi:hypothetical protein